MSAYRLTTARHAIIESPDHVMNVCSSSKFYSRCIKPRRKQSSYMSKGLVFARDGRVHISSTNLTSPSRDSNQVRDTSLLLGQLIL